MRRALQRFEIRQRSFGWIFQATVNSPSVNGVNSSREEESAVLLLLSGRAGVEETSGPEAADSVEMAGSAGNADSAKTAAPVGMVDSVRP